MNNFYIKGKNFFLIFALVLLSDFAVAQSLKGSVTDNNTGEPLVGATVKLEGTKYVSLVKLDGTFNFAKLAPASYKVIVTYAGYAQSEQSNVLISANENKVLKVLLRSTSKELESVTISAARSKEDDGSARRLEKNADPLLNVLSAKTLQLLPDITVANALQRVSGVTIERSGSGEGRYPIIRGMEKRYINTLVNGIKIPSPDNQNRFIPLDLFPSELLERLEVSKSLTPSMEGDAIGGTINLVMKDAPQNQLLQANFAAGYNNIFGNQTYQKFDKSGISKQSPAEINGSTYAAAPRDFSVAHLNYADKQTPVNSTFGLTVGNRFGKDKKFGFIVSGSYQNIYRGTSSNFFLPNSQPGLDNIPLFSELQFRQYSVQSKRTGLNGKFDFQIDKNNKISLINTFVKLNDYQTRTIYDTIALNSLVDKAQRSTWQYQSIYNSTLQGIHKLAPAVKLDWSLVYSVASNHLPDQTQFTHELPNAQSPQDRLLSINHLWLHKSDTWHNRYADL